MWTDSLTTKEAEYTAEAISELRSAPWAASLLKKVERGGGLSSATMPLLVEVRVGYTFLQLGATPEYEYSPSPRGKTIDFHTEGNPDWLIEVFSLRESNAVKKATEQNGILSSVLLSSLSEDPRQSEEGEIVRAMEHIADKAQKFPTPSPAARHLILTDMRGYLIKGGDHDDYREIAYGSSAVPPEHAHFWNGQAILGLFDEANSRNSAGLVQERIHFLGFLNEKRYCKGEIQDIGYYLANPKFFKTSQEAAAAFDSFPLRKGIKPP